MQVAEVLVVQMHREQQRLEQEVLVVAVLVELLQILEHQELLIPEAAVVVVVQTQILTAAQAAAV
jgi:hypothetical protein